MADLHDLPEVPDLPTRSSATEPTGPMGYVAVVDLDRATAFYVGVLGSSVLDTGAPDYRTCVVRAPDVALDLTLVEVSGPWDGGSPVIDRAAEALGRAPEANPDHAGLWRTPEGDVVAWFRDAGGGVARSGSAA